MRVQNHRFIKVDCIIHYKTSRIPCWYEVPVFLIPKLNTLDVLQLLVPEMTLFLLTYVGLKLAF